MRVGNLTAILLGLSRLAWSSYVSVKSKTDGQSGIRWKRLADKALCDGGADTFTGWVDHGDRHFFYWYTPTRAAQPAPLMFWLQGGPGGSSVEGMLMENGPCLLMEGREETVYNPDSWTESYNIIYVDNPMGVGYSYLSNQTGDPGSYPRHAEESAVDFVAVVRLLLDGFPELQGLPIYLAGESYSGRFIPVYATAILQHNRQAGLRDRIPLASIMVGNGLTSFSDQFPALYDVGCFEYDNIPPMFSAEECHSMAPQVDRCERLARQCDDNPDEIICTAAYKFCEGTVGASWLTDRRNNRYDRTGLCPQPGECYPIVEQISNWMNSPRVRRVLEVEEQTAHALAPVHFAGLNMTTFQTYMDAGDMAMSSVPALVQTLEAGIPVLYYAGVNDWVCNSVGIRRMLDNMHWSHHAAFRATPMTALPWKNDQGGPAGVHKAVPGLHWVELTGSGHIAPYDQPKSTLTLVQLWRDRVESMMALSEYSGLPSTQGPLIANSNLPVQKPLYAFG